MPSSGHHQSMPVELASTVPRLRDQYIPLHNRADDFTTNQPISGNRNEYSQLDSLEVCSLQIRNGLSRYCYPGNQQEDAP